MRNDQSMLRISRKHVEAGDKSHRVVAGVLAACLVFGLAAIGSARADMYVYPAKGQSQTQQNQDEGDCNQWAIQQTGVDPVKLAEQLSQPQSYRRQGGAIGGAAGGAAVGAAGGAIGGDAAKGAEIGAAVGGILGHMRAMQSIREQQQATNQAHEQANQQLEQYQAAYSTCLRGKGYSVSE